MPYFKESSSDIPQNIRQVSYKTEGFYGVYARQQYCLAHHRHAYLNALVQTEITNKTNIQEIRDSEAHTPHLWAKFSQCSGKYIQSDRAIGETVTTPSVKRYGHRSKNTLSMAHGYQNPQLVKPIPVMSVNHSIFSLRIFAHNQNPPYSIQQFLTTSAENRKLLVTKGTHALSSKTSGIERIRHAIGKIAEVP